MALLDLVRVTPPAVDLLSLAEMKTQTRVEHGADDAYLTALGQAVTDHLEGYAGYLGRCLISQTWTLRMPGFPGCCIQIPLPPLIGVTSIRYVDPDGVEQTVLADTYHVLDGPRSQVVLANGEAWPAVEWNPRAVTVTFVCGYGAAASDVPAAIRAAALLTVADLYANRGDEAEPGDEITLAPTAKRLLRPHRVPRL